LDGVDDAQGRRPVSVISVIVPTYRRDEALIACLARLTPESQGLGADEFEVLVTDDAGSEETRRLLAERYPSVHYGEGARRGPAANRNAGAARARGDLLVFLDDDCLPEPGLLAAYRRVFAEGMRTAEGRITTDGPARRMDDEAPINETGGYFWSCNVAVERRFFAALGGFDERFTDAAMEDVELRERIRRAGVKIVFVPEAAVVHPWRRAGGWPSLMKRAKAHEHYGRLVDEGLHTPGWSQVGREIARIWARQLLPGFWRHRGRGWARAVQRSLFPILRARALRRGRKMERLPQWGAVR
jgi:GT2 family glycosyltransferase